MDPVAHYLRLLAYDGWANQEILTGLHKLENPPSRALGLMSHIFSAQRLWMERTEQKPQSAPVWPQLSLQECDRQAQELPMLWKNYLAGKTEADLAAMVHYRNSQGQTWASRTDDILMHVVTHSAHHRGQVATAVRAAGFVPAYIDFIHCIRQGFVK